MIHHDPNLAALRLVARTLGECCDEVVFVGGSTVGLLLTDPGADYVRPTMDVDCIIEVTSRYSYQRFEGQLRRKGFSPDPEGPICRYFVHGVHVDVMPTDASILGFANIWASAAAQTCWRYAFDDGVAIKVIDAPHFLATKIEAFFGRGDGDYLASHDIEDIVTVIDGRAEIVKEVDASEAALQQYLAAQFTHMLPRLRECLPGHLPPDSAGQSRMPSVLARIQRIAGG